MGVGKETEWEISKNWVITLVYRTVPSSAQESFGGSGRSTGLYNKPINGITLSLLLQSPKTR